MINLSYTGRPLNPLAMPHAPGRKTVAGTAYPMNPQKACLTSVPKKWKTLLASVVVALGGLVAPAQGAMAAVAIPAGVSITPNVSVAASNPTAYATTTLSYRATITSAGTLTAIQFAIPPGSSGKLASVNGTLTTYAPGFLRWTPAKPIKVSVGSRLSIPVYNLRLPKAATYRLGMNAVERSRYLTAGYGSLTVNPVPPAPDVAVTAQDPSAYTTTTLAYRATITKAGTLTAVQFAIPPGSGGKVTSVNGILTSYAPGYLRWTPAKPIAVGIGSKLSIPVYNLLLPGAATYSLGMNAVENTRYLTAGYGSLTVSQVPPAAMDALPPKPWPALGTGCPVASLPIAQENALPGTTAWAITAQATSLSMWADKQSAACGESVGLRIQSSRPVTVTAYRMGFYAGLGGRKVWTSEAIPATSQPAPNVVNYDVSASSWSETLRVPITAEFRPGVYLLRAEDSAGEATYAPLTVRDDTPVRHDLLIQQATSTWQAYNKWGGYSFYTANAGSSTLSYDRPYAEGFGAGQYLGLERGLTYWAESKGIDVTYWTDEDMDAYGVQLPQRARALWLPAHDEYYSYPMRAALVQAMDAGVHVANLGANTVYREIDYSADHRTWSINRSALNDSTRWRYRGAGWHEQTILGAQYGCAPRGTLVTNSSWLWAGVPVGTVIDGFVNGENDYVQAGIYTPPGQQLLSSAPARCFKNGTMQRVDVVSHVRASGARVINGSTFTYGCFVVKQCPVQWRNSTDGPLVITDAEAAVVSKALGNIAAWQGIDAMVSLDTAVAGPKDNLKSTPIEMNEK